MIQCYDWEKNLLKFCDRQGNQFELQMRGRKTIVKGNSGTGKTLIVKRLTDIIENEDVNGLKVSEYSADNIVILDRRNISMLQFIKGKLIIIDRADLILTDEKVIEFINADFDNRYLIFARHPMGLRITPNYVGDLYREGKTIRLKYKFDVVGWY